MVTSIKDAPSKKLPNTYISNAPVLLDVSTQSCLDRTYTLNEVSGVNQQSLIFIKGSIAISVHFSRNLVQLIVKVENINIMNIK